MAERGRESRAESREPEEKIAHAPGEHDVTGNESGSLESSGLSTLDSRLVEQVGAKEARKLKARDEKNRSIWFGLGMFGVIGWSVAVPTLIGIALGCWLDATFPSRISWCLTFLIIGVAVGAAIAWNWVNKEGRPQ